MNKNYKVIEVTKDNKDKYLQGIVELEEIVLEKMEHDGKIGQLFITGKEGIEEYINSASNHVFIATKNDRSNTTISAAYITQGQIDFTYNDITKYFKCDSNFQQYVKSKYTEEEFKIAIREVYIEKLCAFRYARDIVLKEKSTSNIGKMSEDERNDAFLKMVEHEYNDPQSNFHEKSEIRENLNKYMSLYMKNIAKNMDKYNDFYWLDFEYLRQNLKRETLPKGKKMKKMTDDVIQVSDFGKLASTINTYDKILQYQKYKIYDRSNCRDISRYYPANTANTIELDTYITHPDSRENGIARIITFEGIKKSIETVLKNKKNKAVFLVSTLHEENLSSKYVSEFFGLEDYIFVNRRNGRDRQVHINMIPRDKVNEYIANMEKKIAVLYNYNPNGIPVSTEDRKMILNSQLNYELNEIGRLNRIKDMGKEKRYTGYIQGKESKIKHLRGLLYKLNEPAKASDEVNMKAQSDDIPSL